MMGEGRCLAAKLIHQRGKLAGVWGSATRQRYALGRA